MLCTDPDQQTSSNNDKMLFQQNCYQVGTLTNREKNDYNNGDAKARFVSIKVVERGNIGAGLEVRRFDLCWLGTGVTCGSKLDISYTQIMTRSHRPVIPSCNTPHM